MAQIVSLQGAAQVQRARRGPWQPAVLGDVLCIGDSLRTGSLSRAALALADRSILRVDQRTVLSLAEEAQARSLLEVFIGVVHFLSQQPRALAVDTPFITAGAEGTEFLVEVSEQRARIVMIEGVVRAANRAGEVRIVAGEAASARAGEAPRREIVVDARDAVQWAIFYPPILVELAGGGRTLRPLPQALARAAERVAANDYAGALQALDEVPQAERDARYFAFRAGVLLNVGRVAEARAAIEQALALAPDAGEALAQRSIIATAQNQRAQALADARRAVEQSPDSAPARIALSYALQASLELEEAHAVLREAVERAPDDALAWARLAEVELMLGRLDAAEEAAGQAVALAPDLARTQMMQGFAALARIDPDEARTAFERATALESASPLPRLGLGLARIRQGDLAVGRREIEIAASLDPGDALIRSYLGKAYFEERRGEDAAEELQLAKALDPDDPTPWFYDAIRKQLENRPVEALRDLETSIRLNDNRAPFRSRLLLDRDLAVRNVSLARIYDDLGFDQLALVEASSSLSRDPANWSAHRFLSDAYARLPRHEIARVSELLQAQLLQPININPVQPSLTVADLNIIRGIGPAEGAFNEFHSLFERNQVQVTASGVVGDAEGNEDTWGNEIVASAIWNELSLSAGQFHFETEGFRPNNDSETDIYDLFAQWAITPNLNLQAEFRRRDTEFGDLGLNFDLDSFTADRRTIDEEIVRLGLRYSWSPQSDLLISAVAVDRDGISVFPFTGGTQIDAINSEAYQLETQYILDMNSLSTVLGYDIYYVDVGGNGPNFERDQQTAYMYLEPYLADQLTATVGLAYTDYEDRLLSFEEAEPKFGVSWDITDHVRLRAAAFRTAKRVLAVNQTIEPTEIAGFNQLFDDINGTRANRLGIGADVRLLKNLYGGVELSRRDLEVPAVPLAGSTLIEDQQEELYRSYLYWAPHARLAVSAEVRREEFWREDILTDIFPPDMFPQVANDFPRRISTWIVPVGIRYFDPSGVFGELRVSYVDQEVERPPGSRLDDDSDNFFLLDAAVGYRLPNRRGIISIEARNILDQGIQFQDDEFRTPPTSSARRSAFVPDRSLFGRLTLSF